MEEKRNLSDIPESLIGASEADLIETIIKKCNQHRKPNLKYSDSKSIFGIVAQDFTQATSTIHERKYLYLLWKDHSKENEDSSAVKKLEKHKRKERKKQINQLKKKAILDAEAHLLIEKYKKNHISRRAEDLKENSPFINTPSSYGSTACSNANKRFISKSSSSDLSPRPRKTIFSKIRNKFSKKKKQRCEENNENSSSSLAPSPSAPSLSRFQEYQPISLTFSTPSATCNTIQQPASQHTIGQKDGLENQSRNADAPHKQFPSENLSLQHQRPSSNSNHGLGREELLVNEISNATPINHPIHDVILDKILFDFAKKLKIYPTKECPFCQRLVYPKSSTIKPFILTESIISKVEQMECNDFSSCESTIHVCSRCHAALKKGNIPTMAYMNKMQLPQYPAEIENLNFAEARLISQVKPFLKIFNLSKGRGQQALKGSVIHFPQNVEEVIEKLPLTPSVSDLLIVNETYESSTLFHEFQIRGKLVYAALQWLKINNPLYTNVEIQHLPESDLQIATIQAQITPAPENNQAEILDRGLSQPGLGFIDIGGNKAILRGSFNQASLQHFPRGGLQCAAMSASAIAYASVQSINTWTTVTLDTILLTGDAVYLSKCPEANIMLTVDDVAESVQCFNSITVNIRVSNNDFRGFHRNFPGAHIKRLRVSIQDFVDSDYSASIVTAASYCMALIKFENFLYLADSHARGPHGRTARNGTACVLRCELENAAEFFAELINRNCPVTEKYSKNNTEAQNMIFMYTITPILCSRNTISQIIEVAENPDVNNNQPEQPIQPVEINSTPAASEHRVMLDCVIRSDEPNEPHVNDFIQGCRGGGAQQIALCRAQGRPLYPEKESRLEELAFIKAFPFGSCGFSEERALKITPLDYFQQRIMGSNKAFHNNEYLFYALSRVEAHTIHQKIAVCGNMRDNNGEAPDDPNNVNLPGLENIHLYMAAVRGSASYWKRYTGDVLSMIEQLQIPTFFLTISYDDLNSDDSLTALWKAMYGPDAELTTQPKDIPFQSRRDALNNNPVAASRHFCHRINLIFDFMKKNAEYLFGSTIRDFTYRVEFQGRGSPHLHALLWLDNVPAWETEEGLRFIENNISCSLQTEHKDLVLRYQNHHHSSTCFKKQNFCRFGFPRKQSTITRVLDDEDIAKNYGRFVELKRNSEELMINNYHPKLLQILKCNIDIQAVTGSKAIAYYIGKYISKSEPTTMKEDIRKTIENFQADTSTSYYRRALNIASTIIRHREISAPEAAFRLCHLPLRRSSRSVVFLPTYLPLNRIRMVLRETLFDQQPKVGLNAIERYMSRPDALRNLCLMEFTAHYAVRRNPRFKMLDEDLIEGSASEDSDDEEQENNQRRNIKLKNSHGYMYKRKRAAVVKSPFFNPIEQRDNYLYSLILLYYPFIEENFIETYPSVMDAFLTLKSHFRTSDDDVIIQPELADKIRSVMIQLEQAPIVNEIPENEANDFGEEFDMFFEEEVENLNPDDFFGRIEENEDYALRQIGKLNLEQRAVYDRVREQILAGDKGEPMREFIQGSAGVGKSFLIDCIHQLVTSLCYGGDRSIIKAAFTGIASKNISGITLHKAFSLGIERDAAARYIKLGGKKLHERRMLFKNVKFIILDECSMISYHILRQIHSRCVEIKDCDSPFGGLNMIVFGDLLQLDPCLGGYIFKQPDYLNYEINLWKLFRFTELSCVMRQRARDHFYDILQRLRIGALLRSDIEKLKERTLNPTNINYHDLLMAAKDTLHLYPTIKLVDEHNRNRIEEMQSNGVRIYNVKSVDTYASGVKYGQPVPDRFIPVDPRKCGGIVSTIQLGVGCKAFLRINKDVSAGLCNGSLCIVRGFVWTGLRRDQRSDGDLPEAVLAEFEGVIDPKYYYNKPGFERCVAITPKTFEFIGKYGVRVSRYQIPLALCFSCSIHKAQGMSLDKCTVYLGKGLFKKGMAYVCLSRVRTWDGVYISNLSENSLLVNRNKTGPCNDIALREILRLKLLGFLEIREAGNEVFVSSLIDWVIEYVMCQSCKHWVCICICEK